LGCFSFLFLFAHRLLEVQVIAGARQMCPVGFLIALLVFRHQLSEYDQIAIFSFLICTGARRSKVTFASNQGD